MNVPTVDLSLLLKNLDQSQRLALYREYWHKAEKYEILTDFPMHLDIELSGACNLKCEFCFQNGLIDGRLGFMDVELFKQIIDEGAVKGLCAVKLQIRGESLLYPQFLEALSYAKKAGVLDIQLTTNGTLLNKELSRGMIEAGLDGIIFSVDEQHEESVYLTRQVYPYTSVEQHIQEFLAIRAQLGQRRPWVRLQTAVEMPIPEEIQRQKASIRRKFPDADIIVINRIQNYRDDEDTYPDLHSNYVLLPCSYLMQRLAIFWNGDVSTCCMDYNNRFQLGNVQEHTVQEIWHSEKMMTFRELHSHGRRNDMPICRHCHACTVDISSYHATDPTPRHFADVVSSTT